jgi:hypothetical protein
MTAMTKVRTGRRMSFAALTTIAIGLAWVSLPASASTALQGWPDGKIATAALALDGGGFGLRQVPVRRGNAEVAYPPRGFKVHGTHGYSIGVFIATTHSVILSVFKRGRVAIFRAPATVDTQTPSFAASFGDLGSVSMSFKPTAGPPRVIHVCGKRALIQRGYFVGSFRFRGEGGYTVVGPMVKAPEYLGVFAGLPFGCPGFVTVGPGGPGAELDAHRRSNGVRVEFSASKNRPRGPAYFSASISEHRGRLRIYRFDYATDAPSGSFVYDPETRRAVVDPPPPFRGRGWFRQRRHRASGRWRGTLNASFPGRANVRLAGRSFAPKSADFRLFNLARGPG